MELDVIRGAKAVLVQHRPTLVIEYNPNWTLDELRDQIPYPVKISSIPMTLRDRAHKLERAALSPEYVNILVEPVT